MVGGGERKSMGKPAHKVVVPYLSGRGGVGVTDVPDEALREVAGRISVVEARLAGLMVEVERVERALEVVRDALHVSQPPMWKRLMVRWWKGGGLWREPMLVQVVAGKRGKMDLRRVKSAAVKLRADRGFALNADVAAKAHRLFWRLVRRRRELLEVLGRVERTLASARADRLEVAGEEVEAWRAEAEGLIAEAKRRLDVMGYSESDRDAGVDG